MNNTEFVNKCMDIAKNYKTLYVMGCFGAPMNATNKKRYCNNHSYNKDAARQAMINAASSDTFGFDCVNLIKGILWGWNGNKDAVYGGAKYISNNVTDINADTMIKKCSGVSTDFAKIEIGEALWMKGHIGVYIGNGLAVECTPSWKNCVQITAVGNLGKQTGYNTRTWTKHGKLPYITYTKTVTTPATSTVPKTIYEVAKEVINGKWGNGTARKKALKLAGYDYDAVQACVNDILNGKIVEHTAPKVEYYPKYTGNSNSIVDALKSLKIDSSIKHRKEIATANGLKITLLMTEANSKMLVLLKQGKLIKP